MSPRGTKAVGKGSPARCAVPASRRSASTSWGWWTARNPRGMMLGGYCILHGALRQTMPERESYPRQEQGNVLVHCREGRSRSVALVALYLHLQDPARFPGLQDAIALVREKRGLPPEEWFEAPNPELIDAAAREAARGVRSLRETGIL